MRRRNCTLAARRDAVDRAAVEKLWMTRAKPVDNLPTQIIFRARSSTQTAEPACGRRLRDPFRLIACVRSVRSTAVPTSDHSKHCDRSSLRRNHRRALVSDRGDARQQPLARAVTAHAGHAHRHDAVLRHHSRRGRAAADAVARAGASAPGPVVQLDDLLCIYGLRL